MERAQARPGSRLVLVVEDEPLLLLMAGDLVEDAGLEPIFASNADDAVRILEDREDVGIFFTDVPGSMDGIKLAAAFATGGLRSSSWLYPVISSAILICR